MHSSVFGGVYTKYRLDIQLIGRFKSQIIKENHRRVWFKAYPWLSVTDPSRPPAPLRITKSPKPYINFWILCPRGRPVKAWLQTGMVRFEVSDRCPFSFERYNNNHACHRHWHHQHHSHLHHPPKHHPYQHHPPHHHPHHYNGTSAQQGGQRQRQQRGGQGARQQARPSRGASCPLLWWSWTPLSSSSLL